MKVAIVCDWLTGYGGAERVVLQLHRLYPDAPIYTSQYDPKRIDWFGDADVRTLWLQRLPKSLKKFLPLLRARAFGRLDLSAYDLVISSSGAEAKGVKTGPNTTHISYCHAPTHYYWSRYDAYMKRPGFGLLDPLARLGLRLLAGPMRRRDYKAAQKPDFFIANSNFTKAEIKKYYGRESKVIHPPVDVKRFTSKEQVGRHGFLVAGRQTPYKRFDLAVAACSELGVPLTVIGDGPDHRRLVKMAGPRVSFLTKVPDSDMPRYFRRAEAFIFPGLDDFGITAVEALAAGTPVVAYKDGGVLDYLKEGKNGLFFEPQSVAELAKTLEGFPRHKFDAKTVQATARGFTSVNFTRKVRRFIDQKIG
jgi:glycosyltransferase involved in cell wall biosynthesis